jgi:hypothetical protein
MKRDERGWTKVVSASERCEPFARVGARSAAADARQTNLAFARHSVSGQGPKGRDPLAADRPSRALVICSPFTRHTMPSNFRANSLKTNKSGTHYSTHKSRGREIRFRTLNLIDPPKIRQVQVN